MRVPAQIVEDIEAAFVPPGAVEIDVMDGVPIGLFYACPCGCRMTGYLPFRRGNGDASHPSWVFDGDVDRPTLSPSVHHLIRGVTHWHGYLRAGVWEAV